MFKEIYYRNSIDVISKEGIEVEAQSLWQLKNQILVLVDDDQYATHDLTVEFAECHSEQREESH
ncbi:MULTISPECIES: hypothetical protein [Flavobacteriaceae]|uniref:hypothetical protein n=1 Tax=Flavobacteriaceae TaxID=49546 RepID=UPI003A8EC9AC